jgi:ketosteroid isomerase-like protein
VIPTHPERRTAAMPHPNEQLLRDAYADFARGDLAAFLARCTDDMTFRVPGRTVVSGTFARDQVASPMISTVIAESGGTFRETVLDVLANDARGVVFARHEFARGGRSVGYDTAHVYRIVDGKLASFAEYPEDQHAFDEAWR